MIRLVSHLPKTRDADGSFYVFDGEHLLWGPTRCRGEADNANAAQHNNVIEDPTRVAGDHPAGNYRVVKAVSFHETDATHWFSYGPWFFLLDPLDGEAAKAKANGRVGIGLHGGTAGPRDTLRPTYGCLRLFNESVLRLATWIMPLPPDLRYTCEVLG